MPPWLTFFSTIATVIGTLVTAVATVFLWRVTHTLAVHTKHLAEASSQPHVVATIEPNRWSMRHADLHVSNTGNATAYDIRIRFDPPLHSQREGRDETPMPFQEISVLKPGPDLNSWIGLLFSFIDRKYTVHVSWRRDPRATTREEISYSLSFAGLRHMSRLGAGDPLIQLADEMKKMREELSRRGRVEVNVHTAEDRLQEAEESEQFYNSQGASQNPAPGGDIPSDNS